MNLQQSTFSAARWLFPPESPTLAGGEVHVWRIELDVPESKVKGLRQTLGVDERARADRFHFDRDRRRFIVGRACLRAILGRYLRIKPEDLRFSYSQNGKPTLADEFGDYGINFNLSHSHELALLGVTLYAEIGIDIERRRSDFDFEEIAERFFSPREAMRLSGLPLELRGEAFFKCWTRKEAYIKGRGEGLSHRLDQFDVSLAPGEKAALICTRPDAAEANRWTLQELAPGFDYTSALAVKGPIVSLQCWAWPK